MNARRRRLVLGTERIWSICVWTLGVVLGIGFGRVLVPLTEKWHAAVTEPDALQVWVAGRMTTVSVVFGIIALFILRFHIWPPLAKLFQVTPTAQVFWRHCWAILRRALPYSVLMGMAFAFFLVPLGGYMVVVQIGIIWLIDMWIDSRRDRFIATQMNGFLPNGPEWRDF